VAGLIYGGYHQSSLKTRAKHAEIDREYKRKESLIAQAKAEWKKKTSPADTKTSTGGRMFRRSCFAYVMRFTFTDKTFDSHHGSWRQQIRPGSLFNKQGGGEIAHELANRTENS
jgi:hypothetical protein